MPIEIVQSNSGSFEGTSGSATLGVGTTAGNTVILCVGVGGSTSSTPTGFVRATETPGGSAPCAVFTRSNVPASETSWTITSGASAPISWYVEEVAGCDPSAPVDAVPPGTMASGVGGTTATSDTTAGSTTYDGRVLAVHTGYLSADTVPATFSGHTGGQVEIAEVGSIGAVKSLGMSVSSQTVASLGTFQSTATASKTVSNWGAVIVVLTAAGAKRAAAIEFFWGFKLQGAIGLATGLVGYRYWDTQVGTPTITADGLQCSATAAAESVASTTLTTTATVRTVIRRLRIRFDTSLPGADLELAAIVPSAAADSVVLSYRTASQKLGVKIGTGTEQVSATTVAADTWYDLDLGLVGTTTAFTCDWRLDGVDQTQATFTASGVLSQFTIRDGWSASSTGTVTYAYDVVSITSGHYPLGAHTIVRVGVDPAGTLTVTGAGGTAVFNTFTSNGGTMTAWNATTARDNIDEFPPTISASADGLAQITADAATYVEIPMETYATAGAGSVRSVRMLACGWAASTTAATIQFRGWDGAAELTLGSGDLAFDNSTTDPAWACRMFNPAAGWTQAKLDALAFRVGFSSDATPDVGIHAIYAEVAVQDATVAGVVGEPGEVQVASASDPLSSGVLGITATTPANRQTTLMWTKDGTPDSQLVPADTVWTEVLDALDITNVTEIGVEGEAS